MKFVNINRFTEGLRGHSRFMNNYQVNTKICFLSKMKKKKKLSSDTGVKNNIKIEGY